MSFFSAVKLSESRPSYWPNPASDIGFLPTFACYTEREIFTVERTKKQLVRCPLSSYFPFFFPYTQFQVSLPQFPISFSHPFFLDTLSIATFSLILPFLGALFPVPFILCIVFYLSYISFPYLLSFIFSTNC
jgi:hypothetical protein